MILRIYILHEKEAAFENSTGSHASHLTLVASVQASEVSNFVVEFVGVGI